MKPLILDGIIYTQAYVEGLKQPLLAVRDCLLQSDRIEYAAALSEINAVLSYYCEQLNISNENKEK